MTFGDIALLLKSDRPRRLAACLFALSTLPALSAPALAQSSADDPAASRQPHVAQMLPENTPVAFFLTTQAADWQALEQFELFAKIAAFTGGGGASLLNLPILPPGIDYARDVQPWIGEQVAIAVLPDTTPRSIAVSDIAATTLTVVPVADPEALPPFLERLETARAEEVPEKSTYEGVALWVWPTRTESYDNYDDDDCYEADCADDADDGLPAPLPDPLTVPPAVGAAKAVSPPVPQRLPVPGEFEEGDYTYQVPGLAVAILDNYLVFAQEPAALKTLIDYQQLANPSLADSALFLRSQYTDSEGAIARFYANLSEAVKFNLDGGLSGLSSPLPGPFPRPFPGVPDLMPQLTLPLEARSLTARALQGVTIDSLVYPQAEGIRLQGRLYGNGLVRSAATPDLPEADSVLSFVPAPAYSLNSGRDLAGLWRQIAASLALSEPTREFLQQARSTVSTFLGLDLDTELLGWMDKEIVLFFFPSAGGGSLRPEFNLETGIAIQTSDRATAQKALDALDAFVGSSGGAAQALSVTPTEINGLPAVSWQISAHPGSPQPLSVFAHSWIAEDTVMFTSGTRAMAQLLNAPNFQSVERYPTFLGATESLPQPNNGYSYLNAGSTLSLAYSLFSSWLAVPPDDPFFQTVKSFLGTIRSFGSTTSSTSDYWQLDSLMNLAPVQAGQPLAAPMVEPVIDTPPVEPMAE